jgi:hypothetical protein
MAREKARGNSQDFFGLLRRLRTHRMHSQEEGLTPGSAHHSGTDWSVRILSLSPLRLQVEIIPTACDAALRSKAVQSQAVRQEAQTASRHESDCR